MMYVTYSGKNHGGVGGGRDVGGSAEKRHK